MVLGVDLNIGDSYTANLYDLENNNFLYCNDLSNTEVWAADPGKNCTYKVDGSIEVDTTNINKIVKSIGVVNLMGKKNAIKIAKTLANQKLNDSTTSDLRGRVEGMMDQGKIDEMIRNHSFNHWLYYVFMHPEQVAIWELHDQAGIRKYEESTNYVNDYGILDAEIEDLADLVAFMAIGTMPALDETSTLTVDEYKNRKTIEVDTSVNPKTNYNISDSTIKDKIKNFPDGCDPQDYISVGPYKYIASKGDYIEEIAVKKNGENTYTSLYRENTDIIVLAKTTEGNYSPIYTNTSELLYEYEIGSDIDTEFYILVKKNSNAISIKELKIEIGRMDLKAKWYYLYGKRTTEGKTPQRLLIGEGNYEESFFPLSFEVNLIPPVKVELNKVDTAGTAVEKAKFKIEYSNGLPSSEGYSLANGTLAFSKVQPTSPDSFTATITETGTPAGYKPLADSIVLTFTYNESKAEWEVTKTSEPLEKVTIETIKKDSENTCIVPITVENKSIIEKLTILKTSSVKELGAIKGAKFKLTLSNVASIKDIALPTGATQKTIYVTTDSNGNIVLEDIEIADLSQDVVIKIEETEAPVGYKKIEGEITLTLKRTGDTYIIHKTDANTTVTEDEFEPGEVTLTDHELTLNIKDIPIMNLGGIVWYEDEKTGKVPTSSDIYGDGNGEEALGGIKVYLYKGSSTTPIAETTSSDGNQTATYTNHKGEKITVNLEKGQYMFTDVTAGTNYHVEFEYDGIKYEALTNVNDEAYYKTTERNSKIYRETNRDAFNASTETISGNGNVDESKTNAGWIIKYDLVENEKDPDQAIYKGVYNEIGEQQFVTAKTWKYLKQIDDWKETWKNDGTINTNHYAFNINCGLNKKYFDLRLGTDVKEATVKINGNQTTYTYDQILDGKLDEALNRPSGEKEVEYNLYLAYSDYNYRISDYKVLNRETINNKYDETTEADFDKIKENKEGTELEIYVTYRLQLKNQSKEIASIDFVEYHFDDKYEFVPEKNEGIKLVESETDIDNGKLMINTSSIELAGGSPGTIELTFKVKPDEYGNKCTMFTDYLNQAEIVSYTTWYYPLGMARREKLRWISRC